MHIYIDEDYDGEVITVDIPAGVSSQSFILNITNDDVVECNETFSITIESVSYCGVTIGNINTSEITIFASDGE